MKRLRLPRWAIVSLLAAALLVGTYVWHCHELRVTRDPLLGLARIHYLAYRGDLRGVQLQLLFLQDVNTRGLAGDTPLHVMPGSLSPRCLDMVCFLIRRGADVNARNADGETPLYAAAGYGNPALIRLLLDSGADQNVADNGGARPIDMARGFGNHEAVALLERR